MQYSDDSNPLLPAQITHLEGPSRIPLPKKPSYTLPKQTYSVCPHINRTIIPTRKALNVPDEIGIPRLNQDICSIHNRLTPEKRAKAAAILRRDHISHEIATFGMHAKCNWRTEFGEHNGGMTRLKHSTTSPTVTRRGSLRKFLNKPTVLYWEYSAQYQDTCRLVPFACIYKDWFRYHDNNPDFGFGHFFANPIQITSSGPKTVTEICEAHKCFCDRAASLSDTYRQTGEAHLQDYHMLPLCRAILVILDEMPPNPRARVGLEEEVQRQSVLIVRTTDEAGLSAPIDLGNIRSQSLPLARPDLNTDDKSGNVIRVSLRTAIKFILDLQKREETAFPHLRRRKNNRSARADKHATEVLRKVDRKGSSRVPQFNFVMEEIEVADRGEPTYKSDINLWSPLWIYNRDVN